MEKDFLTASEAGDEVTVREVVLRQGVDINCREGPGHADLTLAAHHGHYGIVMFFLSQPGIDVNNAM